MFEKTWNKFKKTKVKWERNVPTDQLDPETGHGGANHSKVLPDRYVIKVKHFESRFQLSVCLLYLNEHNDSMASGNTFSIHSISLTYAAYFEWIGGWKKTKSQSD